MKKIILTVLVLSFSFLILSWGGSHSEKEYSDVTKPTKIKVTPQPKTDPSQAREADIEPKPQDQSRADSKNDAATVHEPEIKPSAEETVEDDEDIIKALDYVGWEIDERRRDSKVCFAFCKKMLCADV